MESETFLDPIEFLRALHEIEVPYLLVGRQALVLLGSPLMTADYDFYLSPEREHLDRLLSLARQKGLEVSVRDPERSPFFSLLSDNLKLDFFRCRTYSLEGGEAFTFAEIYARRKVVPVEGFAVYVPSLEDLLRTKRIRSSPKDLEDMKYLQVLLEREAAGG
jgi:hypothetical protein